MNIGVFEIREIYKYFHLDEKVKGIQYDIRLLREEFYSQSMSTLTFFDGLEIKSIGFNPERNVIPLVDEILIHDKRIKEIRKKQRYFNDYLNTLDPIDKQYLIERYNKTHLPKTVNPLDIALYEEIMEIEEAINFMKGHPPDTLKNFDVDNDNLENDFDSITNLLGV